MVQYTVLYVPPEKKDKIVEEMNVMGSQGWDALAAPTQFEDNHWEAWFKKVS